MTDVHDKKTRSKNMRAIKNKDTKPEILLRRALHRRGFRYRKNKRGLPGTPDIVFKKYSAVVQVHGCYWHAHDCHLFKIPSEDTDVEFWENKFIENKKRDASKRQDLENLGWRVCEVWQCSIEGRSKLGLGVVADLVALWLKSDNGSIQISGNSDE